jgi:hypothetical protein
MNSYIYGRLQAKVGALRLVVLQPGSYHDVLHCEIVHHPFLETAPPFKDDMLPISELQKTLPVGWTVD